eukprot:m.131956 g.131956  ORF g.131956 m.131956 type:complete len:466 (-) comp13927_c0_seq4:1452-2849(-)
MSAMRPPNSSTYTFASQPRAVQGTRRKYREPQQDMTRSYGNMMYDPRIVRGNTFRKETLPAYQQPDPVEIQRQQELQRKKQARLRASQKPRARTPEAVDGRKHMDVQTELYLEELTDRVEETDNATQTDAFLDRPPSPLFVPPKTGIDVATQILEGELFDFDIEVKPILEVLVGKTLEQALMEVMEEEELDRLRDHQREFEDIRNAELAEMQRLEEAARRREQEKEARIQEQRKALVQQKETAEKIAARAFAHSYLADLVPSVFSSLNDGGFFYDRQEREIESQFMPWLMDAVDAKMSRADQAKKILDGIIRSVIGRHSSDGAAADPEPAQEAVSVPNGDDAGDDDDDDDDGKAGDGDVDGVPSIPDAKGDGEGDADAMGEGEEEEEKESGGGANAAEPVPDPEGEPNPVEPEPEPAPAADDGDGDADTVAADTQQEDTSEATEPPPDVEASAEDAPAQEDAVEE